jgi:hypothetical protein
MVSVKVGNVNRILHTRHFSQRCQASGNFFDLNSLNLLPVEPCCATVPHGFTKASSFAGAAIYSTLAIGYWTAPSNNAQSFDQKLLWNTNDEALFVPRYLSAGSREACF